MDVAATYCTRTLQRNLDALRAVQPALAEALAGADPLELEPTGQGRFTARVATEDGQRVHLASRLDPVREARRWIGSLELEDAVHAVAVVGLGLGYHVAELLRQRPGGLVVALEPTPAVARAALQCVDLADDLRLGRLVLAVGQGRGDLQEPFRRHTAELMMGTRLAQHPASARAWPAACGQLQAAFADYTHFARSALVTAVEISATSTDNLLRNLPHYLGWPGIDELKDAARGRVAICIAAGPSLAGALPMLKQAKGRAVLIAVQTVLRPLLEAGIRPDFVTALDYSPISGRFYEGLGELPDVTLIADAKVHPVVPERFPGPRRLFRHDLLTRVLGELDAERDTLQAGSTVAHLNLYLARYLGCDPIVLVGQDLGFGGHLYYAPGNPIHTTWAAELNRFNSLELMEWQRVARMGASLRTVPGSDGPSVTTDAQMFTYLQQFEADVARTSARVVNATAGGARIAGTERQELAEVLAGLDEAPLGLPAPAAPRPDSAERFALAAGRIRDRLGELARMQEVCDHVLESLRAMVAALNDAARFNRLHAEMDRWRRKIDDLARIYSLVADAAQVAELKRIHLDTAMARSKAGRDVVAQRREELTRDIQYVSLLRQGAELLEASLHAGLERLGEGAP